MDSDHLSVARRSIGDGGREGGEGTCEAKYVAQRAAALFTKTKHTPHQPHSHGLY